MQWHWVDSFTSRENGRRTVRHVSVIHGLIIHKKDILYSTFPINLRLLTMKQWGKGKLAIPSYVLVFMNSGE